MKKNCIINGMVKLIVDSLKFIVERKNRSIRAYCDICGNIKANFCLPILVFDLKEKYKIKSEIAPIDFLIKLIVGLM